MNFFEVGSHYLIVGLLRMNQHQHCVGGGEGAEKQEDHRLAIVQTVSRLLTRIAIQFNDTLPHISTYILRKQSKKRLVSSGEKPPIIKVSPRFMEINDLLKQCPQCFHCLN